MQLVSSQTPRGPFKCVRVEPSQGTKNRPPTYCLCCVRQVQSSEIFREKPDTTELTRPEGDKIAQGEKIRVMLPLVS